MAINDPFAAFEQQPSAESVIIQEIVNPVPGNSLLLLELTEFQKGLLIGLILIYLLKEL